MSSVAFTGINSAILWGNKQLSSHCTDKEPEAQRKFSQGLRVRKCQSQELNTGRVAPELTPFMGPLPLVTQPRALYPTSYPRAHTCQVDGDPAAEETEGHMSEEAAVVQKPVRPGREEGRKEKGSGGKAGGGRPEEGGNDPALGKRRSMWGPNHLSTSPSIHSPILPVKCLPPFTIHPFISINYSIV